VASRHAHDRRRGGRLHRRSDDRSSRRRKYDTQAVGVDDCPARTANNDADDGCYRSAGRYRSSGDATAKHRDHDGPSHGAADDAADEPVYDRSYTHDDGGDATRIYDVAMRFR
jgi:hypothetical protein